MNINISLVKAFEKRGRDLRWNAYLSTERTVPNKHSEQYVNIVRTAHSYKDPIPTNFAIPKPPYTAVSHFASWVHDISMDPLKLIQKARQQDLGKQAESSIENARRSAHQFGKFSPGSLWNLVHNGTGENHDKKIYVISDLVVNGRALVGSPDYVFKEQGSGRILIVEIKNTNIYENLIPSDGWPDMRAQLWAYSLIDEFRDAPEVILASEIWFGEYEYKLTHIVNWRRGDEPFMSISQSLFTYYKNLVEAVA